MTFDLAVDHSEGARGGVSAIAATRFGGYTLVAKLGQGAMAEVFLAIRSGQAGFRKLVVIKRLHPHLLEEQGVREMFMDEARLAALLSHVNVVQTNEVAEADGQPFMAMDYLDGQPMSQIVTRCMSIGEPLPAAILARIVSDALDGLQHAHDLHDLEGRAIHVVHRDVSPHNLFVCYDGITKVLDFGVAKASMHAAHTEIGAIKGKYAYLSPEQAEQANVDGRTDVWGMGVVLWEGLTGRRLFKRETEMATLKAVTADPIPPVRQFAVDAPPELAAIAQRALQRDLSQRYASAHAMREDLEGYLRSLSEPASPRAVSKFLRSMFAEDIDARREAITACVRGEMGDVTGAHLLGETTHPSYSNSNSVARAVEPAARSRWTPLLLALVVLLSVGLGAAVVWPLAIARIEAARAPATPADPAAPIAQPEVGAAEVGAAEVGEAEVGPAEPATAEATAEVTAAPTGDAIGDPNGATEPSTDDAAEPAGHERAGEADRPRRSRRAPREPRTAATEAATGTGALFLDSTPWATVYLGERSLGDTPLSNVQLPAGRHVLTLRNAERGISQRYTVDIEAGQVTRRRVGLR